MLHNIKCRMFKMIGRNIAECQDAFEDGIAQGKILRQKYREAKEEIKAKEDAKNNPVEPTPESVESNQYAYDNATI